MIESEIAAASEPVGTLPKKAPKRSRRRWSTIPEQRLLLTFIRDVEPSSKRPTVISIKKICEALGWPTMKVMEVRSDFLEEGHLDIADCLAKDMRWTYGYRITEAGWRFLGEVK